MQENEKNDSSSVIEEQNTKRAAVPPNKDNTYLTVSPHLMNLSSINFNIVGTEKILKTFIDGVIKIIELLFKLIYDLVALFLEHKWLVITLLIFVFGPKLSIEKNEASLELLKSLAALFL